MKLLLFCILAIVCWPLALAVLLLYPLLWLLALPFRVLGLAVTGVFALLSLILLAPVRVLRTL